MSARPLRAGLVGLALLLAAACGDPDAPGTTDATGEPPRYPGAGLLIVSVDTLRADRLGCYGYDRGTSPFLDELAAGSVVFEDVYAASPKTASSHMSLFTSTLPTEHGVTNASLRLNIALREVADNRRTLPEVLNDAGYWNAAIAAGGNMNPRMGFAKGFTGQRGGVRFQSALMDVSQTVDFALQLAANANIVKKPPFLFVHTYQVHSPYRSPKRYRERFLDGPPGVVGPILEELHSQPYGATSLAATAVWRREHEFGPDDARRLSDCYDAAIAYTDDQLRRLFTGLETSGLLDRMIVVILSDHGEEFGEHGDWEHDQLYREHLHVPLIVRLPDGALAGTRVSGVASLIDVMPTLLELLELDGPDTMNGVSLVGAMTSGSVEARAAVVAEHRMFPEAYRISRRTDADVVTFAAAESRVSGWDLAADPDEQRPIPGDDARVAGSAAALRKALVDALALREAWDAEDAGKPIDLDPREMRELEALNYVEDGSVEAIVPDGTPLDAWPEDLR